jgi:competence protein ComEA
MRRELVLTAIVSAAIGAGLMLLATGARPPAGIEGWTPVNAEVQALLAEENAPGKGSSVVNAPTGEAAAGGSPGTTASTAEGNPGLAAAEAGSSGTAPGAAGTASPTASPTDKAGDLVKSVETGKISINRAGLAELQEIPGIGEKKAQAILDYRNTHGAFASIEELTQVKGIGDKMLEKMKPYIGL